MRKVLIPTDFSENAMNALKYALELFKYEKSVFYIMHAYKDEIYEDQDLMSRETMNDLTKIISNRTESKLATILEELKEISPNPRHTYHTIASNNLLLDETDKIVDSENIDVIVMGTRGKTDDRRLTFGTRTLQVLKYVQCPVLAIPKDYKYNQPKHILFPTDYLIPYKRRELKLLCELASPYRAKIDLLHVSKTKNLSLRQEDNQNFILEELHKTEVSSVTTYDRNKVNAIYTYIKEHPIDMLVMVNTRHSFLENILFQSTIDKISLYIDIPFLALQNIRRY